MFISAHFHVLAMRKSHFQYNALPEVATAYPRFCNEPHPLHVLFVNVVPGTTFPSLSNHHFVVIRKAEQQVRKASHCGTKQQRSYVLLILFLLIRTTWCFSSRTSRSWWIACSPPHLLRDCNTCSKVRPEFLGWLRVKETSKMETEKT